MSCMIKRQIVHNCNVQFGYNVESRPVFEVTFCLSAADCYTTIFLSTSQSLVNSVEILQLFGFMKL